jgi:hypothetical protein
MHKLNTARTIAWRLHLIQAIGIFRTETDPALLDFGDHLWIDRGHGIERRTAP